MASSSGAPDSSITGQPTPFQNGNNTPQSAGAGRHGLPIQLNITGNGSASIYYFDRPGTYNVWLGPTGAPSSAEYAQDPRRKQKAISQSGSISSQAQPRSSRIPVLKP